MAMERCPSGLWCRSRKAVSLMASVGSNPTLSAFSPFTVVDEVKDAKQKEMLRHHAILKNEMLY